MTTQIIEDDGWIVFKCENPGPHLTLKGLKLILKLKTPKLTDGLILVTSTSGRKVAERPFNALDPKSWEWYFAFRKDFCSGEFLPAVKSAVQEFNPPRKMPESIRELIRQESRYDYYKRIDGWWEE